MADEPITVENLIDFIFSNVEQIQDTAKINILAKIIARELIKLKKLVHINNEIIGFHDIEANISKKNLSKMLLLK